MEYIRGLKERVVTIAKDAHTRVKAFEHGDQVKWTPVQVQGDNSLVRCGTANALHCVICSYTWIPKQPFKQSYGTLCNECFGTIKENPHVEHKTVDGVMYIRWPYLYPGKKLVY